MLPLRLFMENFGSFRAPVTVDFHDVDYFVLVGPTGAGKSTVIDAICFALYGTVPRWGKENVVALALAPSATSGKVALVFESGGRRYGVVRVLARSAKGVVSTREARLEELDPAVDPGADIEELLGAVVRPLAEGDQVTTEVQQITGLKYGFFTQCVILPQGRFAEFLHSPPSKRQDLLVQLLDAMIYERIRQRATTEEERARTAAQTAQSQLTELTDADEAAELAATNRLDELRAIADQVRARIEGLRPRDASVADLEAKTGTVRNELDILGVVTMPGYVPTLATDLKNAGEDVARLADEATRCEEARTEAEERLAGLGDKTELAFARQAHEDHRRITGELTEISADLAAARAAAAQAEEEVRQAEEKLGEAEAHLRQSSDARAATAIARRLVVGDPCPVCLHTVAELPQHPVSAGLDAAERDAAERKEELGATRQRHRRADRDVSGLDQRRAGLQDQLAASVERMRDHPDFEAVRQRLNAIELAERDAERMRRDARGAARAHKDAIQRENALRERRDQAFRELDAARDTVVAYGAPPLDKSDLHAAWATLLAWRDEERERRRILLEELGARLAAAVQARDEERETLRGLLDAHGIPVSAGETDAIDRAVAVAIADAGNRLDRVRDNRRRAAALAKRVNVYEQDARIAHELALRLRANNFEKWLCSEALEMLVAVASDTLRDLSDGQFELTLSDKSDIEVIDYAEAGMRRSVRTLSGGETFQASLALALALSDQIAGLGATASRSLDSIFLDEGFGTLDPATLDTVATTLERLSGGDRMVGLVTHVPALASRVPVRFEVHRDAAGSHLEKSTT
jgi:DNA repair protein SbcC/Rad50